MFLFISAFPLPDDSGALNSRGARRDLPALSAAFLAPLRRRREVFGVSAPTRGFRRFRAPPQSFQGSREVSGVSAPPASFSTPSRAFLRPREVLCDHVEVFGAFFEVSGAFGRVSAFRRPR
jgi:hypothetical protein